MKKSELKKYIKSVIHELNEIGLGNKATELDNRTFEFSIGDKIYHVIATYHIDNPIDKNLILEVKFLLMNNPKSPLRKNFKTDMQYQVALRASQVGITETGDSLAVFTEVMGVVDKLIKSKNPKYIMFTGEGESRKSLYSTLIKWSAKKMKLSNYKRLKFNPLDGSELTDEEFWVKRID
jgi:hypothetical protein